MINSGTISQTNTPQVLNINFNSNVVAISQLIATIRFEIQRNIRRIIYCLFITLGFFILMYLLSPKENFNVIPVIDYIRIYIDGYVNYGIIYLNIIILAGYSLVMDFETKSGHIIFPKISRSRLFIGRYLTSLILNSVIIALYYTLVAIVALINYSIIPTELIVSFGWIIYNSLWIIGFVYLLSASMKTTASTMVTSLFMLFLIFAMIEALFMLSGASNEPLFVPSYFVKIIAASLNFPAQRYQMAETGDDQLQLVMLQWNTPSIQSASCFIGIYALIFIGLGILIYRRREL